VLDPFAGGGSIPLESLRLGCETFAFDYNPVATLILKCTLEYPQRFGSYNTTRNVVAYNQNRDQLLEDVSKWAHWVLEEARAEIQIFFAPERDGSIPVGFIWARTINCQNPLCNAEIPLMKQYWLVKRPNKAILIYPAVSEEKVQFKIVGTGYGEIPKGFDPNKGTISRAVATCLVCGSVVDDKTTRKLFEEAKSSQRMIAVILSKQGVVGKKYRIATDDDIRIFDKTQIYLKKKRDSLLIEWGIDPVPDEDCPGTVGSNALEFRYNFIVFGDYFNDRQKLVMITFAEKIRQAYEKMSNQKLYVRLFLIETLLIWDQRYEYIRDIVSVSCIKHLNICLNYIISYYGFSLESNIR